MHYRPEGKGWLVIAFALFSLPATLADNGEEPVGTNPKDSERDRTVQKVNVVAERFNFTPSQIRVKEGTLLEINLTSEDTFHGFRMPSVHINRTIPARGRGSVKVVFDAKEKGSYSFECSRPCGAGHTMMRGVIVVE
jgi:cytochrome c oxidase subunit II